MADYNEDKLTSDYNEAAFQISRLQNIKLQCENARSSGSLIKYKWKLQSFEIELCADVERLDEDEDEEKLYSAKIDKINIEIEKAEESKNLREMFNYLIKKEKLLRSIQEAAGKGSRLRPQDDDLM